jgi:guanylate kinase
MIVLVGESASGKSSIEKYLVDNYEYKRIISYTTRPPRKEDGEIDGVHYHFIDTETFVKLREQGFFAETTIYRGWYYGSAKDDCTDDKVCVMNPHGLRQLLKNKDLNITSFYINVPRRDRLIKILQRGDDIEESYRRNVSDVGMFDGIEDEADYVICNYGYKKSIKEMSEEIMQCII